MKNRIILATFALLLCASAANGAEIAITPRDSVESVLSAQKGKRVTIRLRSGQELTGIVRDATPRLVHFGTIAGREFFDAIVPLESVEAVLVRTKD